MFLKPLVWHNFLNFGWSSDFLLLRFQKKLVLYGLDNDFENIDFTVITNG